MRESRVYALWQVLDRKVVFYSFGRSKENAGKSDSFGRSFCCRLCKYRTSGSTELPAAGSVLRACHGLYGLYGLYGLSGLVPQSGLSLSCPIVIRVLALAQGYRL